MIKIGFVSTFLLVGLFSLQYMLAQQYQVAETPVVESIPVQTVNNPNLSNVVYIYVDSTTSKETCMKENEPICSSL